MGTPNMPRILAFTAIMAWGVGLGGAKLAVPAGSSLPGAYGPESGKAGRPNLGSPFQPDTQPTKSPEIRPERPSRPPGKEERTDCDDCVIVKNGQNRDASSSVLAGTLWGLFMVRRPRRMPRAIIRGVTVP